MSHANPAAAPANTPLKRYHLVLFQAHDSISYDTFRSVRKALDSFVSRDAELARSVLASDDAVDNLRTANYHELTSFMENNSSQIPQALRLLNVVRNLERIADHATNIAEDVLFLVKGIDVRHHNEERVPAASI